MIGCMGQQLMEAGAEVLAVEPDSRMARVASNDVSIAVGWFLPLFGLSLLAFLIVDTPSPRSGDSPRHLRKVAEMTTTAIGACGGGAVLAAAPPSRAHRPLPGF
jgi:hypothetical protein